MKLDREIQQLGTEGHFEKGELEELGRLFPLFQGPVDLERDQREFKHTFQRVKEITERASSRARRHMAEKRMPIDQGSRLLADFRAALDAHLQLRRAETVSCLAANAELPCSRFDFFILSIFDENKYISLFFFTISSKKVKVFVSIFTFW